MCVLCVCVAQLMISRPSGRDERVTGAAEGGAGDGDQNVEMGKRSPTCSGTPVGFVDFFLKQVVQHSFAVS